MLTKDLTGLEAMNLTFISISIFVSIVQICCRLRKRVAFPLLSPKEWWWGISSAIFCYAGYPRHTNILPGTCCGATFTKGCYSCMA